MLLSASQEARAGQDLAQIGLGRGRMAALSGGLLDDDEASFVCAAATPPRHASGGVAAAPTKLASSSSSTHGSETLGVVLRVSLARVLHVCVERGRGALRARGYRSTLGKQTLYGALESAYRASGGERRRPRRHLSRRARVISAVRFASDSRSLTY